MTLRRFWISTLLLAAALGGCERPRPTGPREDLAERRTELQAAIAKNPRATEPRTELVRVAIRLGDGVAAEAAAKAALGAGGDAARLRPMLARAYAMQGDGRRALETLDGGPVAPDMVGEAAWVAADIHLGNGNLGAARGAFDRAVREMPRNSALWVDVARFRDANADAKGARDAIDYAIELDAGNGAALGLKANLVRAQEGLPAALAWYDKALQVDPDNAGVLIDQAATLGDIGHYRAMLAALRRAAGIAPGDPRLYYLQAVLAARAGNYRLARSLLQRTRGEMDDEPGFMLLSTVVELQLGGEALAATWADRLVAVQPHNFTARRLLAAASWADGDDDGAAEALQPIVARADADSWSLLLAARVAAGQGRMKDSAAYQTRAATLSRDKAPPFATDDSYGLIVRAADAAPLDPGRAIPAISADIANGNAAVAIARAMRLRDANLGVADAHILLGDAAMAGGRYDLAVQSYRAARDLDAGERIGVRLADALVRADDPAGAAAAIRALGERQPSSIVAERLAGQWAMKRGDWNRAIAHFDRVRRRIGNRDVVILRDLARAWAAKGDDARALSLIALAYRLQPLNAAIMRSYADLLEKRGDRRNAADLRDKAAQVGR